MMVGLIWNLLALLCLIDVTYAIGPEGMPIPKCDHGEPLKKKSGVEVFCGRGPTREECPPSHTCVIHPTDGFAVCCLKEERKCAQGEPLKKSGVEVFCGRGTSREECPPSHTCVIHPTDRFAVCCPREQDIRCFVGQPLKNPSGKEIYCGGGQSHEDCPPSHHCNLHPADAFAVCCPNVQDSYCPNGNCDKHVCDQVRCKRRQVCNAITQPCHEPVCPKIPVCVPFVIRRMPACENSDQGMIRRPDMYGGDTNQCYRKCPRRNCCKGQYCEVTDENELVCKDCPKYRCPTCPSGMIRRRDRRGCRICRCKDPCKSKKCNPGNTCVVEATTCEAPPCEPIVTCRPCPLLECYPACEKKGYVIKKTRFGCDTCTCINPCESHVCPFKQKCELLDTPCAGPGQDCPPKPACVPCAPMKCTNTCPVGQLRRYKNGCETCECYDPCKGHKCDRGKTCLPHQVECVTDPCPKQAMCFPCPMALCAEPCPPGKIRRLTKDGCETCTCYDPCKKRKCKPRNTCIAGICTTPPCDQPVTKCIPCPMVKCRPCEKRGYIHAKTRYGCNTCTCISPCKNHVCKYKQKCKLLDTPCAGPGLPCPPQPGCVPCDAEKKCKKPCRAEYIRRYENGCGTCRCHNPCKRKTCPMGQKCILHQVQCVRAPCPPLPKCVKN